MALESRRLAVVLLASVPALAAPKCGPPVCEDLQFLPSDQVLQDQEDAWKGCMDTCEGTFTACMEAAAAYAKDPAAKPVLPADCNAANAACQAECYKPGGDPYPYLLLRDSPVFSWEGDKLEFMSVRKYDKDKAEQKVIWSVKCKKEKDNCIESPVVYGVLPEGTEVEPEACEDEECDDEHKRKLIEGQSYIVSGARDVGERFPCVPEEEMEAIFDFPNRANYSYDDDYVPPEDTGLPEDDADPPGAVPLRPRRGS
ncbi:MAG: hypothetical protein ABIO70_26180 [Pseudomonadota bacterium]